MEKELLEMIQNSKDPAAAMAEAIKVILCYLAQPESFREQAADLLLVPCEKAG